MALDHIPVLKSEVLKFLNVTRGVYLDGTLGGGGHAEAVLQVSDYVQLIGIDRDPEALERTKKRLAVFENRFRVFCAPFASFENVLRQEGIKQVNGILLDLGVSSQQLESPERGFSFRKTGPLDMRMGATGETLKSRLGNTNVAVLTDTLRRFGEEKLASKIAKRVMEAFHAGQLQTTTDLAEVVAACYPSRDRFGARIHPATRTFQALRIWINEELDQLQDFLAAAPKYLTPNGRLVILSYHSLEDRMVKQAFRRFEKEQSFSVLTKKPVAPTETEIEQNPRARSAKLRALMRNAA